MFGRLARSDEASSSGLGLVVAVVFFAGAFVVAQSFSSSQDGKDPNSIVLDATAATALEVLARSPGIAASGGNWADDADSLERFGLAESDRPHFLDYAKVRALWNGTMGADATNDAPDYLEVKQALGLTDLDFHLRSYPVLMSIDDARWQPENHLRVAYFAHYSKPNSPVALTTSATAGSKSLNVTVEIENLGSTANAYVVEVSLGESAKNKAVVSEYRHTSLVAAGTKAKVHIDFWALDSWANSIDGVRISVKDGRGKQVVDSSATTIDPTWITPRAPPADTASPKNKYNIHLEAGAPYYQSGQHVEFVLDHYTGNGGKMTGAKAGFVLIGPNGKEWTNTTASPTTLPHQNNQAHVITCTNCTTVGTYTAIAWDPDLKRNQVERVHVSATELFNEKTAPAPLASQEILLLKDLVKNFNPTLYDAATNPTGDIFADEGNMAREMVDLRARYTTIVIGSEAEQSNLAPQHVKDTLATWVSEEGGNLVVLGTYKQESRWLRPVWGVMQATAGSGISAPDATHPILSTPDRLDYQRYLDRGRAWTVPADAQFTHVLTRGEDANGHLDTLAVSAPGTFDSGTVVLTSYMPGSLTEPQDAAEAKRFLHNMLNQGHSMLFIDFGPPIPSGVPVGSATRLVVVPHPNVPDVEVEVRLVMYVFG